MQVSVRGACIVPPVLRDLAIPILPSRSLPVALDFYARLGFAGEIMGAADEYASLMGKPPSTGRSTPQSTK